MKYVYILALALWACPSFAQLGGRVSSQSGQPLAGATLRLLNSVHMAQSGNDGRFSLPMPATSDTLLVRFVGYAEQRLPVGPSTTGPLAIVLLPDDNTLEEVEINTGFYRVPPERVTGSFTHIDGKTLNRAVGGSILQRLEGIASGVQFTEANGTSASDIRIRGLATIQSDGTPLIVVDNFPYEGDINTINPNDVESITVLKDAAAASIWGARAGNGVIVITTKRGGYGQQARISLNSNVSVGEKPNLFYSQNRLPSNVVLQLEKDKYEHGGYYLESAQQRPFPQYVELLIARDSGWISEADFLLKESSFRNTEVRDEALKYLYQPSVYQQYALGVQGGGQTNVYYLSAGYDKNRSHVIGDGNNRLNLSLQNTFRPLKGMELTAGVWYTQQRAENNGLALGDLAARETQLGLSPYTRLKDNAGNNLPIVKDYRLAYVIRADIDGLLDWQYRPLDEVALADNRSGSNEMRLNGGLRYSFLQHFDVNVSYQYVRARSEGSSLYHEDSYYVRDMVNRFTQGNGSYIIPHAAIFSMGNPAEAVSHSGRAQLNFVRSIGDHAISALGGGEIREYVQHIFPGYTMYDYDPSLLTGTAYYDYVENYTVRPTGRARIPQPSSTRRRFTDRYLSYFGNASYTYRDRYVLSGSARWDGSNLFGVKTNQKGTPLWSLGASWEAGKEPFYRIDWLPYLRMRATYGSSGNVNKQVSVFPTIRHFGSDANSGLNWANVISAGNPSLRWEQVNTLNLAVDFATKGRRISGTIDYYAKDAKDLIGEDYLPPSTGIITGGTASATNLINYANLRTQGLDVQLASHNIRGAFQWTSTLLLNYVRNRVTGYHTAETSQVYHYTNSPSVPVPGRSRDAVYAFPWNGLEHDTGMPLIYVDGVKSDDYGTYYSVGNLMAAGVSVPPFYGSLRNDVSWKGLSVSVLLAWKTGYVFRRKSSVPGAAYISSLNYHMDYLKRWQQPGDEQWTSVPVHHAPPVDSYMASVYELSETLITNADHIRLQDINVGFTLPQKYMDRLPLRHIRLYAYARNLGILWRANKNGIDPDYPNADFAAPRTFAIGVQMDF
ncbi:SusC/RagA family TonB-linked outer membrane protein [Parapedobacter koreensis]|uniref:TonB-linked outer membrane protein, SusC/RagA family n=1 Tax=Parapedobacter koreensis TaxID=332977 RepID=A0A1H7RB91_9SPHI|nr:SusC/RagA family TonB-linked outer membrane protein [Parapedobacter koreensis]SEL57442.1 TonB-linked outer membrane protein, SusC/RagA family [Parapedobacter koreensis]